MLCSSMLLKTVLIVGTVDDYGDYTAIFYIIFYQFCHFLKL